MLFTKNLYTATIITPVRINPKILPAWSFMNITIKNNTPIRVPVTFTVSDLYLLSLFTFSSYSRRNGFEIYLRDRKIASVVKFRFSGQLSKVERVTKTGISVLYRVRLVSREAKRILLKVTHKHKSRLPPSFVERLSDMVNETL